MLIILHLCEVLIHFKSFAMTMYGSMSTKELVTALKQDDRLAFKYMYNLHYGSLVAYISTYTKDQHQSEDIVQHSFISLWHKRDGLLLEVSPKSYLYTIAFNRYIDQYRKSLRKIDLLDELRLENLRNSINEDQDFSDKRIKKLKQIIEKLPPRCKKILIMSKQRGLDYKEIANQLDISPRTVEEQIRIAFKKIRKAFKEDNLFFFLILKKIKKNTSFLFLR